MKKVFMILATLAVASMTFAGCNKEDGKKEDKPGKDEPEEPVVEALEFFIDGDFSDWDALTAETATEKEGVATLDAGSDYKAVKVLKVASNEESILVYTEISVEKIQVSDKAHEGGNSWDGHGDASPGPFILYMDLDGNPQTGFTTHCNAEGEPLIPGIGCEVGCELYLFIDATDGKCKIGWDQMVYEPDGAQDGDEYQCGDWWGLTNPAGGWDDTQGHDNICPRMENYKTQVSGAVVKIEFSIEKSVLAENCKRGHDMGDTIIVGCRFMNNDTIAATGLSGLLTTPLTIKL